MLTVAQHNVLVSNDGNALLADFGLSTTIQKAESEATTATGIRQRNSLRFTAPELLLEEPDNTEPEGDDPLSPGAQIIEIRVPQPGTSELLLEQSVSKEHGGSNHSSPGRKRRRSKTPASDVYAFGMLVLEVGLRLQSPVALTRACAGLHRSAAVAELQRGERHLPCIYRGDPAKAVVPVGVRCGSLGAMCPLLELLPGATAGDELRCRQAPRGG